MEHKVCCVLHYVDLHVVHLSYMVYVLCLCLHAMVIGISGIHVIVVCGLHVSIWLVCVV